MGRTIPKDFAIDQDALIYKDTQGLLTIFYDGKTQRVSNEKISLYQLNGNTLKFTNSLNEAHFFVNGTVY